MNKVEINKLGADDISKNIDKYRLELKELLYKNGTNDLKDISTISKVKKIIARLLTKKGSILQGEING
jgi:ribosomal protein L29